MISKIENLLSRMTDMVSGRKKFIEDISIDHENNWQNVSTPYDIVREMCDLVPEATHFCVLFSMEFLEVLVKERGVPCENVLFFGDNELEADMAGHPMMYGVNTRVLDKQTIVGDGFDSSALAQAIQEGVDTMKFNKLAVLMNPPYQINNDKGGGKTTHASPLYHSFIEVIIDKLCPSFLVSINPSRWMIGGRGLDEFRKKMRCDRRMKVLVDDMSPSGIFPSVDIAGGVNYFLWDIHHNGKCLFNGVERFLDEEDIVIRENEGCSILQKVKEKTGKWVGTHVSPQNVYGVEGNATPTKTGVPCWFKQSIGLSFVDPNVVKDPKSDVQKWRVLVPRCPIAGQTDFSKPISFFNNNSIILAKPGEYCTRTHTMVGSFDKQAEAKSFISYLRTRFFRFMLRLRVVSQDVNRKCYNWVPDVEDYSTAWTDEELYDKFGLTRQERAYIESKIKELK